MNDTPVKNMDAKQKETLISMIGLFFIEEHGLLNDSQLADAKASLQALFLHSSGEETMLHKLIGILRTNKALNQTFNDMAKIMGGIARGADTIGMKIDALKQQLKALKITAEENADFVGPFLRYSHELYTKVLDFRRLMQAYQGTKENEARYANMFRIAQHVRARLKQRLSGELGADTKGELESQIKEKVTQTFDFGETEVNYNYARRESKSSQKEIQALLDELKAMCQMVMNPNMRETKGGIKLPRKSPYEDVFTLLAGALRKHPRLDAIKGPVLELFRLFQYSYGLFNLDFQKFNNVIEPMMNDTDAYFQAKEEDEDIQSKKRKLAKIEGLISFLEHAAGLLQDKETHTYQKFSKKLSDTVTAASSQWVNISEDLLRMKISAEAEYSTRLA